MTDTSTRANASQFFIAGELCRRGYSAVVTLGNTPNTDILCSNLAGTRFVHIQIKTFVPGGRTCSVGVKAEKDFGENFFWVLGAFQNLTAIRPSSITSSPRRLWPVKSAWLTALGLISRDKKASRTTITKFAPLICRPAKQSLAGMSANTKTAGI